MRCALLRVNSEENNIIKWICLSVTQVRMDRERIVIAHCGRNKPDNLKPLWNRCRSRIDILCQYVVRTYLIPGGLYKQHNVRIAVPPLMYTTYIFHVHKMHGHVHVRADTYGTENTEIKCSMCVSIYSKITIITYYMYVQCTCALWNGQQYLVSRYIYCKSYCLSVVIRIICDS
jgi:hypothetical protein